MTAFFALFLLLAIGVTVIATVGKLAALAELVGLALKHRSVKGYWGVAFRIVGRGRLSVLITLVAALAAWLVLVPTVALMRRRLA